MKLQRVTAGETATELLTRENEMNDFIKEELRLLVENIKEQVDEFAKKAGQNPKQFDAQSRLGWYRKRNGDEVFIGPCDDSEGGTYPLLGSDGFRRCSNGSVFADGSKHHADLVEFLYPFDTSRRAEES